MSDSISLLFKKEQPWANRSCHSLKKGDHERITLINLYKRATMSESLLISLKKPLWFEQIAVKKWATCLKKCTCCMLLVYPLFMLTEWPLGCIKFLRCKSSTTICPGSVLRSLKWILNIFTVCPQVRLIDIELATIKAL